MAKTPISRRIIEMREARGFTASDLARLTNVTPTAVWNWEKNGTKPRPDTLASIAKALGVSPEYLLTGVSEAPGSALKVPDIISRAEAEIANASGMEVGRVKIRVEFLPG